MKYVISEEEIKKAIRYYLEDEKDINAYDKELEICYNDEGYLECHIYEPKKK